MARYIDVDKALLELQKFSLDTSNSYGCGYSDCLTAVEDVLNDTPTAEVEEVRHGEWKHSMEVGQIYNHHYWNCSLCGVSAFTSGYEKYCHECGAKMDGGKAE